MAYRHFFWKWYVLPAVLLASQWRYAVYLQVSKCHKNTQLLRTVCVSIDQNAPKLFLAKALIRAVLIISSDPDGEAYKNTTLPRPSDWPERAISPTPPISLSLTHLLASPFKLFRRHDSWRFKIGPCSTANSFLQIKHWLLAPLSDNVDNVHILSLMQWCSENLHVEGTGGVEYRKGFPSPPGEGSGWGLYSFPENC